MGRGGIGFGSESWLRLSANVRKLCLISSALAHYAPRNRIAPMIKSFGTKETAALFAGLSVRRFGADWTKTARRKLAQLDAATTLEFLRTPPGNGLERLSGDRAGQYSIRINDQWRLCFDWRDGHAFDVEIVDYH